jgi:hypothetical protein
MRMARAFIASIPLGVVLIAAVIVPVALTPGTFGFQSWPTSHGEQVTDRPVREVPRPVTVVKAHDEGAGVVRTAVAATKARTPHTKTAASTRPDRQTANLVMTPHPGASPRHGSSGQGHGHGPARHGSGNGRTHGNGPGNGSASPAPASPATPASPPEPQQPSTGSGSQPDTQLAGGDSPVLRPEPAPAPPPPPAPVEPVTPVVPTPPLPQDDDGDHHGHGNHGDHHGGPVRDLLQGLGIGRRRGDGNDGPD